jgi:flagellar basal body rod protein FlgB
MAGNTPVGSVTNLNQYLGIHPAALKVGAQRNELLARNLANADTPNYKSQDIDFRSALAKAGGKDSPAPMTTTNARHIAIGDVANGGQPQHGRCAVGTSSLRGERRALSGDASVSNVEVSRVADGDHGSVTGSR